MSVTISVKVEGAEVVRKGLENWDRDIPRIAASRIFERLRAVQKVITTYPPKLPGQRYRRTGRYGRGWRIRRNPRPGRKTVGYSLIGRAVSKRGRDYTKFVTGDAFGRKQAAIHQNRWPVAREEIEEAIGTRGGLPKEVTRHLQMAARRRGL